MEEKTENARRSALMRWSDASALLPHSKRNANGMQNDAIKVKESKEKENSVFPPQGGAGLRE